MTRKSSPSDPLLKVTMERVETFLAVAEHGGIASAVKAGIEAGRVGETSRFTAQSQYSHQIAALEATLGTTLFQRGKGAFALTEAGRTLRRAARDWRDALSSLRRRDDEAVGLTLVAGDSVLAWRVIPRIGAFLEAMPRVRLTLRASSVGVDEVLDGRADVAIGSIAAHHRRIEGLKSKKIGDRAFALFVPCTRPTEGRDVPWLLRSVPLAKVVSHPAAHDDACRAAKVSPAISLACETFAQAARAVAAGTHAAVLPVDARAELGPAVAEMVALPALRETRGALHLVARSQTLETIGVEGLFEALDVALGDPTGSPSRRRTTGPRRA